MCLLYWVTSGWRSGERIDPTPDVNFDPAAGHKECDLQQLNSLPYHLRYRRREKTQPASRELKRVTFNSGMLYCVIGICRKILKSKIVEQNHSCASLGEKYQYIKHTNIFVEEEKGYAKCTLTTN